MVPLLKVVLKADFEEVSMTLRIVIAFVFKQFTVLIDHSQAQFPCRSIHSFCSISSGIPLIRGVNVTEQLQYGRSKFTTQKIYIFFFQI